MHITLAQFERIDGIRRAMLRDMSAHSHITGQPIRPVLNDAQHENRLFDAIIDLIGYADACEIGDLGEYADSLITDCLTGKVDVLDGEAA